MKQKRHRILTIAIALLLSGFALSACAKPQENDSLLMQPPEISTPEQPPEQPTQPELPPVESEEEPPAPPAEPEKPKTATYIRALTNDLNVRSGAGTKFSSLGKVERGVLFPFIAKKGEWYVTRYRNQTAYLSANAKYTSLLSLPVADERVEAVISEGENVLGTPYVYGAVRLHDGKGNFLKKFTPQKFDCSSLMQYIFYEGANVLLNTTTRTQIGQGKAANASALKRGDLLFFTNDSRYYNVGLERVGHVALYLGENYILHTASDYAKIEQISSKRWNYFLSARSVL